MKIAVIMRQVVDLVEPLEIDASSQRLDLDGATFIVNEADDHALEQALLLKEAVGGEIVVVAIDFGDVDNTLYYSSNSPSFTCSNTSLLALVQALAYGVYAQDKGAFKDRIRAFKLK